MRFNCHSRALLELIADGTVENLSCFLNLDIVTVFAPDACKIGLGKRTFILQTSVVRSKMFTKMFLEIRKVQLAVFWCAINIKI